MTDTVIVAPPGVIVKPPSTASKIWHHSYKAIIAITVISIIAVSTVLASIALMNIAHQQHLQTQVMQNKTSQDSQFASIVWPDGTSQNTIIDEEITPAKSSYKAGGYRSEEHTSELQS